MTDDEKKTIDDMSYESMLRRWRNAPVGDSIFANDTGKYYQEVMQKKRLEIGNHKHVEASKRIGWNGV